MKLKHFQRASQLLSTVLYNGYIAGFVSGIIYQGTLKYIPCPGLNCYSCPSAVMSCPIGALQLFVAYGKTHFSFYVTGCISAIGALTGRLVCGWACPFGLFQDMLYKIPSIKIPIPQPLTYIRYIILFLVVGIIALTTQEPWFCKLCPAGTIEASLPMITLNKDLRHQTGTLFLFKAIILFLCIAWMIFSKRPFCRVFCPLGTLYSFFNRVGMLSIAVDTSKCIQCSVCLRECPMDIHIYKDGPDSSQCIRCFRCVRCPAGAIRIRWLS